jgi:transcriptional regulator with XRE-family HTH domain
MIKSELFMMAYVATVVREARLALGWTQEELAKVLGWQTPTVNRLESGKHNATLKTLARVFKVLDIKYQFSPPQPNSQ